MGRTIDEMIAMLPVVQQQEIYERTEKMISELTLSQKHMSLDEPDLKHITYKEELARKRGTLPSTVYDYLITATTLPEAEQNILLATPWVLWNKDGAECVAVQIKEDRYTDYAVQVFYDLYDIPSNSITDDVLRKDLQCPKTGQWLVVTEGCEQQHLVIPSYAFRSYLSDNLKDITNLRVNTSHIAVTDRTTGVKCAVYRPSTYDMHDTTVLEIFLIQHQTKSDIYIRGHMIYDGKVGNTGVDISPEVFLVILENRVMLIPSSAEYYRILKVLPTECDKSANLGRLQLGYKYVSNPDPIYGNKLTVQALQYTGDSGSYDRIMEWTRYSKTKIHLVNDRDNPHKQYLALFLPGSSEHDLLTFGDWVCTQDINQSFFVLSDNTFRTFFR